MWDLLPSDQATELCLTSNNQKGLFEGLDTTQRGGFIVGDFLRVLVLLLCPLVQRVSRRLADPFVAWLVRLGSLTVVPRRPIIPRLHADRLAGRLGLHTTTRPSFNKRLPQARKISPSPSFVSVLFFYS